MGCGENYVALPSRSWVQMTILFCFYCVKSQIHRKQWRKKYTYVKVISRRGVGSQELVVHACNHSYSGGRDQEDRSSKPAQFERPYLEKGWWSGSR
jgi:hypothetical protein